MPKFVKSAFDPSLILPWAGHIAHQAAHLSNYRPEALLAMGAFGKGSLVNAAKKYLAPTRFGQAVTREGAGTALRTGAKGLPSVSPVIHNAASLAGDYEVAENMSRMHALGAKLGPEGLRSMHNLAADKALGKDWIQPAVKHLGPLKDVAHSLAPAAEKYQSALASIPTEANTLGRKALDYMSTPVSQVGKDIGQGIAAAPGRIAGAAGKGLSRLGGMLQGVGKIANYEENKMIDVLDPHSAVLFRSGQLHKIAASLIGKDEVTIADAVAKIAENAYIKRAEEARIREGLAALESI